ncbi:uncharacterized protein LOC135848541 [Planococcus citri]|uniref:uncharacterized protein LOC135848541 n=1 Tax=Planococcus citri TaxID=170843 RepID=UPI0031F7368F
MSSEDNNNLLDEVSEPEDWKANAKEAMREWNAQFYMWKTFDESQSDLVKTFVGFALFGRPKPKSPECDESLILDIDGIELLHEKYDDEQKKKIAEIYKLFKPDDGLLRLSHTLLYTSEKGMMVCVFRQIRPIDGTDEVHFIDFNARVYKSWDDFVKTNKLPKCEYMAPENGIHEEFSDEFEVHESPASSRLGTVCDWVACGATIAAVGLSFAAAAPVATVVLGGGSAVYGVHQSVNTLLDRSNHKQSIAPTNLESVGCYMNIGTTAVCGATTVAVAKSASILELSGRYSSLASKTILGLNYASAGFVASNFGLSLYAMQHRLRNGEFSVSDLFDLSLNIFMIYGTVSNLRQVRSYLSTVEANPTPPKGLSKGARRRWRKRQAKLTAAKGSLENQGMTKVGAWDSEIAGVIVGGSFGIGKLMLRSYYPDVDEMYERVKIIIEDFRRLNNNEMTIEEFIDKFIPHGKNLYQILRRNSEGVWNTIKDLLQRLGIIAPPESIPDLSNIIDDGRIAINNIGAEISPEDESVNESASYFLDGKTVYEIILDLIEYRIRGNQSNEVLDVEKLLVAFAEEMSYVTIEIKSRITQKYEDLTSKNVKLLGEEKAKLTLSKIGINSKNDFATKILPKIIENLKTGIPNNISNTFKKQLDEIFSFYRELFLLRAGENDISSIKILETCEILNKSVQIVMEPIISCYKISKEIYEVNIEFFEHESAMAFVFSALNLNDVQSDYKNYDESLFINVAKKTINLTEILPQLLFSDENSTEYRTKPINEPVTFTDEYKMETLLTTCDFYVQKMESNEISKIYSFVTDKFVDKFQCLANQSSPTDEITNKLKPNIENLGANSSESNKMDIFNQTAEMFRKEEFVSDLVAEYYEKMCDITNFHAQHLKHLVADDGATMYMFKVENRDDIEEFKEQAANLFNLNKDNIQVVKKNENLIILKNEDKYVAFQFIKNQTTEALIMQIDVSKKNEENA